jgi:tetratricopeptide (TPR) repeat protein
MEHKKINGILAGATFLVALITYLITVAPTTSYWDCGEFITASYILGVPHPPGAPLYILVGRIFTMLPLIEDIGLRVNIISVLVSAFSVMFTYLIIVRFMREWHGIPNTLEEKLIIYTSGLIGALGFAFSDSFWFNAVEAEVYAVSMFFTAIVVWLILVWAEKADDPKGDKILLLIAYLMGLATGVHLLNLLALPTIALIIYFKKSEFELKSLLLTAAGTALGFLTIYPGIVKGVPYVMSKSFLALAFIAGVLLFGIYYTIQNRQRVLSLILMSITLVAIGYSTYTALYIRSGLKPAINENNPDVPSRFASYLNREQYGDIPVSQRRAPLWEYQIKKMYVRYFGWQFIGKGSALGPDNYIVETLSTRGLMALPFLIGMIGMFHHFNRDWKRGLSILSLFVMTGVAIALYLNQEDPQPRERDYAYVGSFFAFALWIGMGAGAIMELVLNTLRTSLLLRRVGVVATMALLCVAVPFNLFGVNFESHNRTGNYVAWDYSYNILQTCEPDAIIFTNGDNDTFPLWYLQYVHDIRPDVRIVNLSLLNTPWYIKQLRDEEPKVPINLGDAEIERLSAQLWEKPQKVRIPIPRERVLAYLEKGEDNTKLSPDEVPNAPRIEWELRNTKTIQGHPVVLVQDVMVVHIIQATKFSKPIYFAVTVSPENMIGLDNRRNSTGSNNYLRMDGLAFQVMPYGGPGDFMSPVKLDQNLFEDFQYRNLDNPDVYYNDNVLGLLQNYRSAFLRLTTHYQSKKSIDPTFNEKAIGVLDRMENVMPEEVIPLRSFQLSLNFGRMYFDAGRPDELERRIERILKLYTLRPSDKAFLAGHYSQFLENYAKAESLATASLDEQPNNPQAVSTLIDVYQKTNQLDKAVKALENYVAFRPDDRAAQGQLAALKLQAATNDSLGTQDTENGTTPESGAGSKDSK